uniref:HEPN domain-containing protein n=1 Tax=Pararhizobium sp. IMCC3301 TaxID=3067904 RepID=UPI00274071CC|nr:HEPN domain-containing protein [Pararhizobium sp. IMCC3301]
MSEKSKRFEDELDTLIADGNMLYMAIQHECVGEAFEDATSKMFKGNEEKIKKYLEELPDFKTDYQAWYSEARAVVKQIFPDRLNDFISYYELPRVRKDITFQNYMIRDYLQGLHITRGWENEVVVEGRAAIPEFVQQLNIVKAAKKKLNSSLLDLTAILQADLFDSEVDSARALAKAGFLRASGAICGVVIEKHLKQVCVTHNITVRKKNPGISDLNQLLKDADVVSTSQWRFVQHLADIRNICDHAKGKEPTKDEIEDLVSGTEKILKSVF